MKKLDLLKTVYAKNLEEARKNHPDEYVWPIEELPAVLERMFKAIEKMSFNKDGTAWKNTFKELGIKPSYKALEDFLKKE